MISKERINELIDNSIYGKTCPRLTKEELQQGAHYCWDWDELFVCPATREWECCTCYSKEEKKEAEELYFK